MLKVALKYVLVLDEELQVFGDDFILPFFSVKKRLQLVYLLLQLSDLLLALLELQLEKIALVLRLVGGQDR